MRFLRTRRDGPRNFEVWLDLQREMQSAVEARLRAEVEDEPPFLAAYRESYERDLPAWTGDAVGPAELTGRLLAAQVILVGDYHSLPVSQRTALRLLKRLEREGAEPALALEMVPAGRQAELDAFLAGGLSRDDLERLAEAEGFWDFPWRQVQILLDYARYHGLPVLALNRDPEHAETALPERDRHAAAAIAAFRERDPERRLVVLFGDYHLAADHLPASLAGAHAEAGLPAPRLLRVFQNAEPLYWQSLAAFGRAPQILDLAGGAVCIQSATPYQKLQSYLSWLSLSGLGALFALLGEEPDPGEFTEDLSGEVDAGLRRIAAFLRVPLLEQAPARVLWIGEPDFAERIAAESRWSPEETAFVRTHLERGEDCYLPGRDLGVLAEPGGRRIAELAAKVLHGRSARIRLRPRTLPDDFCLRVISAALEFLGAKVIDPLRPSEDRPGLRVYLKEECRQPGHWQDRAELVLAYLDAEARLFRGGDPGELPARFHQLSGPQHIELTRAVGRHLGARLHDALIADRLDPVWLRDLYFESFALEGSPVRRYFEIHETLGPARRLRLVSAEHERL